ncbi:ribosome small subunit-dependent GTPase A [Clostridium sp. D2Q-11]|uniref:Small ribosomal subunit biogenesis GTPase RsgA n=1 Tax=Anaeromonas frigoriresistens TaxID=2683708 RepID=A0A942V234_9FIRM|nr:ribosome small subunit-dependent GTPase A [Anaeromonas frigoriresistens]MBS4539742.1 ribosome small subunit-dependent GTPase A [Anaeromonas frigoriresistens]
MLEGIIIKGIGGLYYVKTDKGLYECKARGLFRKDKIKPLVGDKVLIELNDIDDMGYIMEIKERDTVLIRPPVANVNQVIIVFALKDPSPNLWLLDRFLILAEKENLDAVICFNKIDLLEKDELEKINNIYNNSGYEIINTSTKQEEGIEELKKVLKDKISVFAGPSGVGKSSLLNTIQPNLKLQTGEISEKTKRGKHTTRSSQLMELYFGGWVVDTPGFSSLDINFIEENELQDYFPEILEYSVDCKFNDCKHYKEPKCGVKDALEEGKISEERYNNYLMFLDEIKNFRRY